MVGLRRQRVVEGGGHISDSDWHVVMLWEGRGTQGQEAGAGDQVRSLMTQGHFCRNTGQNYM